MLKQAAGTIMYIKPIKPTIHIVNVHGKRATLMKTKYVQVCLQKDKPSAVYGPADIAAGTV